VAAPDAGPGYRQVEFIVEEMGDVLAAADLIVSRAGLSALTEMSALGKPSILIPMPDSHQNANARVFADRGAAVVLQERETTPQDLAKLVTEMANNRERLDAMGRRAKALMPPNAEARIADALERLVT
jgi:UDP-N-acetylglucosamine--N-acetylmuramyl-(pentapeptide) pyrophosphoryl-undecaprenol N-acetylglucosamine transferase